MQNQQTYTIKDLSIGLTVRVATHWGIGPVVSGKVTSLQPLIKPDQDGFCYTKENGREHWAYVGQVVGIENKT